jgi:transcriptional regulator with XRE-family HTH domain
MLFGDRLRMLREEKNITQKELGKILNVSDRVIGYYEANDRFPRDENILRNISEYFDVSLDWLLGLSLSKTPVKYNALSDILNGFKIAELPKEAINSINEYIEYVKNKYSSEKK